jgi:membrane-bound inhibitor of C-type lysozyme
VTKDDKSLDTLDGSEPRSNSLDSLVVDGTVLVEGSDLGVSLSRKMEDEKTHWSRSDTSHVESDTTSRVVEG